MEIERPSLGDCWDRLEAKGWVRREVDPNDRRVNRVYLTNDVEPLMLEMRRHAASIRSDALAGLSEQQTELFVDTLLAVKQNLHTLVLEQRSSATGESESTVELESSARGAIVNIEATGRPSGFGRAFKRFFLLVLIPVVAVAIAATIYFRGGRFVTSENAYVKTNIIAVSADVDGRALPGIVANNQSVKQGDFLFSIDPAEYQLQVAEAQATMELVRTEVETLRAEHNEVQVSISEAQERIAYYQRQYRRHQSLKKEGIGSAQAADDALFNLKSAQQRVKVLSEKSIRMLTAFKGDESMPVDQHPAFVRASVHYQQALAERQKTTVNAPVAGVVSNNSLQAGEYVDAGRPVFSLIESGQVWIEVNLKETQLTHLLEGQQAIVSVDAYPDVEWKAVVTTIAPATGAEFALLPPQNATGNWVKVVQRVPVNLGIEVAEDQPALRAGMTASVSIDTRHSRQIPHLLQQLLSWLPVDLRRENPLGSLQAAELLPATNAVVVASFASDSGASKIQVAPEPQVDAVATLIRQPEKPSMGALQVATRSAAQSTEVLQPDKQTPETNPLLPEGIDSPVKDTLSEKNVLELLDEKWIEGLPGHLFTLQVGTSTNRKKLTEFADEFARDAPMMVYLHRRNDDNEAVFALAHGLYSSRAAAHAALTQLPSITARFKPWVRRISDVQKKLSSVTR